MSTTASASRQQLLTSLRSWRGTVTEADRALFKSFVEAALSRLRGSFLSDNGPKDILTAFEQVFAFLRVRAAGEVSIDITAGERGEVVLSAMEDQAFIVDTQRLFLKSREVEWEGGFNLVLPVQRDGAGRLVGIGGAGEAEAIGYARVDGGELIAQREESIAELRRNLLLSRRVVADFGAMKALVAESVARARAVAGNEETVAFLEWLLAENFVFMGAETVGDSRRLGFQNAEPPFRGDTGGEWPAPHAPGTVAVRKSDVESVVHRGGRLDEILVTVPGVAPLYLRGMFTHRAITTPSRGVPVLRGVLAMVLAGQQAAPGSYRYKGIANAFDAMPTEFLLATPQAVIADAVDRLFEAEQVGDVHVSVHRTSNHAALALIAMPQNRYSEELRRQLEGELCSSLGASCSDSGVHVSRFDTVLLHWWLRTDGSPSAEVLAALTARVSEVATPWSDRLWAGLQEVFGEAEADRLADRYANAFGESWIRDNSPERTIRDLQQLEAMGDRRVAADLYDSGDGVVLRLFQSTNVHLTDILPVLDHFGLVVMDAAATSIKAANTTYHVDSFRLQGGTALLERAGLLTEALHNVFAGLVGDDALNRLVVSSGLSWREVDLLRGYMRYCRQFQVKIDPVRMVEILLANPVTCHALVDLFHARFDPDLTGDRAARIGAAEKLVGDELKLILSHDEDLLLSAIHQLIGATVRTNYYRTDRTGWYLSFKLDCSKVALMGRNRPMFEIWVHAKEVEGVHLRFGKVARGGLRWSDRDDFRTEVLGLVTTQQVKNVVIVPTGSKGGFFLKRPSRDAATRRREADLHYETFIRGLLEVTDTTKGGVVVPPPRVVRHDPDDPYLVVAADKGTAHLSDTANRLSIAYGHWLGDAFASGGSNGYDHKKVGITARGAWVLVKRHFAEMGRDPYSQPFTVMGVGDLGGDVFGNGLIESPHARLFAAFNHVHIFLDPDPDAAKSYQERVRLFQAVKGWDHYDRSLLSKGGGVFDRSAKSIPLSPEVRAMLGLEGEEAQPDEVMRAILKMDVDLFWNGGIGTYVKALTETDADADDRANDAIRISAPELRAKVVGEGGNLGFTQKGRIEAALLGVRLNTDAIDNSGGVDMSDHEVNLKILLDQVVSAGRMTLEARNALLEEMTEEVAGLVLADNDTHGRQLSRDQLRSKTDIFQFGRAIAFIEREFGRRRDSLTLPSDDELVARSDRGEGLTRPELAVLQAWVKMYVRREMLAGDPTQLPGYDDLLVSYFPKRVRELFPAEIRTHMLAKEIATTMAITRIVADAGAAFFPLNIEATGSSVLEIAAAYLRAQRLARTDDVRAALEQLRPSVALPTLNRCWVAVDSGAREVTRFWLSSRGKIPTDAELEGMRSAANAVFSSQASEVAARHRREIEDLKKLELPADTARLVLDAQYLNVALMVWSEAERARVPFAEMVVRHLAVARASRLQDVIDSLSGRPASGRWDPLAYRILYNRFYALLNRLVANLPVAGKNTTVDQLESELSAGPLADVRAQVDAILGRETPTVSTLLVLEERLEGAIARLHPSA